jgi:hypothetical protein
MGNRAFDEFLASIQAKIGSLNNTVTVLENRAASYKKKADVGNEQAATDPAATEDDIKNKKWAIEALKAFFVTMKKDWSEVNDRVIGQVVWAPPITGKKKIWPNFMGNVIDFGAC